MSFVMPVSSGITPACAGNSVVCGYCSRGAWDHPRLRGEQITETLRDGDFAGSPPLARGTDVSASVPSAYSGITPACAGNSTDAAGSSTAEGDHPRLRGEQTKKRLVVSCILQYRFSFFNQFFVDMFC